jgi:8-amino-7-oxononanoate synthase
MIHSKLFETIHAVPVEDWNQFVDTQSVSLEIAYLKSVELSGINQIKPYYFIAYQDETPIGIAYGMILDVDFAKLSNSYPPEILETIRFWKNNFMKLKILEMGHIASLGTTIQFNKDYSIDFLELLHLEIEKIAMKEKIDVSLIRDISKEQITYFQTLKKWGFCCSLGYPIARMEMNGDPINGYFGALKSKKRNQLLHRRSKIQKPEISVEIIEDYGIYADRLTELWTEVAQNNNGYEHERLTPSFFIKMAEELKGRSHIVAIKREEEIIAFGLNLIGDSEYFGMAEGLDYQYRDQYDLYFNNIFSSFEVACSLGKKIFNMGITTYDFKCSIGCELEPTFYLIKSFQNDRFSAVYADYICNSIQQPDNFHRAFKNDLHPNRKQLKTYKTIIQDHKEGDLFDRHHKYIRIDKARAAGLYQLCPPFESAQTPIVQSNGKPVIMLGANAYLGLSVHPDVCKAAIQAIEKYGTGCSGSPLLNGTLDIHIELAEKMATFVGKESALLFSTGYQTNVGTLSALTNRNDIVIMDERNHASLPPSAVAAVLAALKVSCEEPERRKNLIKNAAYLAKGLNTLGFEIYYQGGPIIALYCRNEHLTVAAYQFLFEHGVFVNAVTSPAVPKNHELLRISLMATHTKEMLDGALQIFETLKTPNWPKK